MNTIDTLPEMILALVLVGISSYAMLIDKVGFEYWSIFVGAVTGLYNKQRKDVAMNGSAHQPVV